MNISYHWLRAVVPGLDLDPDALAERLALRGAPVEDMVRLAEGLEDIVVGRVVTSERHPDADRLSVCTVDDGEGLSHVVCGAPNVRAGGWYPFARVGARLPGGTKIKKAKIRGQRSVGMLCSARELGLGADHTGILELEGDFRPGQPLVDALDLDDVRLDVEVTANRGDLLSHVGVAREVAPGGVAGIRLPDVPGAPALELAYAEDAREVEAGGVHIRIEDPELCARYLGAVIRGVDVGPSPAWLQDRLRAAGARPINNVVDATNYVLLELGQPLHAFDLARLEGPAIIVRRAGNEASFTTLDGERRTLRPDMLMICDARRPVAAAGVMGGLDSEVDDATTDVLLECALFDPPSIRATRKALGLSTDASYRFERGVDPEAMRRALERAVEIILATAGGTVDGPVLDVCPRPWTPALIPLRLSRVEHVLGVPFTADAVRALLEPLGFEVRASDEEGVVDVRVPGFRSYDVTREIDLIEEVARTHGYDAFPDELGPFRAGTVPDHPLFRLEDDLRDLLAARGFMEAQTPAFVGAREGEVRVANPLNVEEPYVRQTLLPSLLRRVEYNLARGNRDVRLFEIGTSFRRGEEGRLPLEESHLVVAFTGRREPPHWSAPDEAFTIWNLKAVAEDVARTAWGAEASVTPAGEAPMDPIRPDEGFALLRPDGATVGRGGRITDGALDVPAWAGAIWGIELALPAEPEPAPPPVFAALPQHPAVERDLALLVPEGVPAVEVDRAIRAAAGKLLEAVELFDLYPGEALGAAGRSLAYRLRFRAPDRTLRDKEADRAVRSVLERLARDLGIKQRGG